MGQLRVVSGIAAITVGLLIFAAWGFRYCARQIDQQWAEQLDQTADAELALLLRATLDQGDVGMTRVVRALGSARTALAEAAMTALCGALDQWQSQPAETAVLRLMALSDHLAAEVEGLRPSGKLKASELAARMLRWPDELPPAARGKILDHCDLVMHTAGVTNPPPTGVVLPPIEAVPAPPAIAHLPVPSGLDPAGLPGGGLPVEVSSGPTLPTAVANASSEAPTLLRAASNSEMSSSDPPARFRTSEPAHSLESRLPVMEAQEANPLTKRYRPGEIRQLSLSETRAMYAQNESRSADNLSGTIPTLELIHRLKATDPTTSSLARDELVRRGFGPMQFQLADRIIDPNPSRRKELAEELPGLAGVDPASWLLWLTEDDDADVRLTAVTWLASTDAPDLLRQVQRIATQDPDPRVQGQLDRIAQRRRAQQEPRHLR